MKNLNKNRGVSLIAAIAIMILVSVLSAVMASMLGVTSRGTLDSKRSSQALGLAQAGMDWYMMRLAGISDWSTETNQANVPIGDGTFDVAVNTKTSNTINFTVTGKVSGTDGTTVKRTMTQSARRVPQGANFALFWGNDNGNASFANVTINGDYWSRGTTNIPAGSSVASGIAYRPDTENITGAGSYTEQAIISPYPAMPDLDVTYYTGLISGFDANIAGCSSGTNTNQNVNLVLTGNTICRNNFNTNTSNNTNVTISGFGTIIADQNINLAANSGTNRSLTISPSGGNINIIAARNLTINDTSGSNTVTINPGTRIYAASNSANGQLLTVNNNNTNIDGSILLAKRRMIVRNSANITGSDLFVSYPGTTNNNYLRITNSGTSVGTLASPCNIISIGRLSGDPAALTLDDNASVTGFLYQFDAANSGQTRLNSVTITGSLLANELQGNAVASTTITYDSTAIPDPKVTPFFASKDIDSWSGN